MKPKKEQLSEDIGSIQKCIAALIRRYRVKFNLVDHEVFDLESEAQYWFARAYNTYPDDAQAKLITYVYAVVNRKMFKYIMDELRPAKAMFKPFDGLEELKSETAYELSLAIGDELSEDAKFTVKLLLNAPARLRRAVGKLGDESRESENGKEPRRRKAIRLYLKNTCGWSMSQIDAAFEEIKSMLHGNDFTTAPKYVRERPGCSHTMWNNDHSYMARGRFA